MGLESRRLFDESPYIDQDRTATGWPRITPPSSVSIPVFVSHTSFDIPACQEWILPAIEGAVSNPSFLNYYTFSDPRFRDAYARQILVNLRCSEHLVVVLSRQALDSPWVNAEVCWWVRRRGINEITVVGLDRSKRELIDPCLAYVPNIRADRWRWLAGRRLTLRLRHELRASDWFVIRRWPRRIHRSMTER